jgi:hypothetical protein
MKMTGITITEALQEIKTINKRLEKKRASLGNYLARDVRTRDPLAKDGGSEKFVASERQAIGDLEDRIIRIRTEIQRSNLNAPLVIGGKNRTVAEWLTWRREVANGQVGFLKGMYNGILNIKNEIQKKGGKVVNGNAVAINESFDPTGPADCVINVDEKQLLVDQETLEQVIGDLDGKLSLFNATTVISV